MKPLYRLTTCRVSTSRRICTMTLAKMTHVTRLGGHWKEKHIQSQEHTL